MSEAPQNIEPVTEPAAPAPTAVQELSGAATPPAANDWRSSITDEALRSEAAIANYASVDDFVKGHLATKALASSKLTVPGESEESRKAFSDALRPADAAAYEIEVAEGAPTEFAHAARQKFFDMGLPPHWAKEIVAFNNEFVAAEITKAEEASAADVAEFKKAYGANYDAQLGKVGVMLKSAGIDLPDEELAALDAKLGSSNLLRFMFDIADRVGPLDHLAGDDVPEIGGAIAPEQARGVLEEKRTNAEWRKQSGIEGTPENKEFVRLSNLIKKHRAKT
jgi:hypothetical protein